MEFFVLNKIICNSGLVLAKSLLTLCFRFDFFCLGCPHNGKCLPFGKEWTVDGGEVLRCVGDKTHFYLESVMGGKSVNLFVKGPLSR